MGASVSDERPVLVAFRSGLYHDRWPGEARFLHAACGVGYAASGQRLTVVPLWVAVAMHREPCRRCWPSG